MSPVQLSAHAWKGLIVALALAMGALLTCEAYFGVRATVKPGVVGYTGIDMINRFGAAPDGGGTYEIVIPEPGEQSPLLDRHPGLHRGDVIRFSDPSDRWRLFQVGEPFSLTHVRSEWPCSAKGQGSSRPGHPPIPCSREGAGLERQRDGTQLIRRLAPDSPLARAEALKGDRIRFDNPLDRWRWRVPAPDASFVLIRDVNKDDVNKLLSFHAVPGHLSWIGLFEYWSRLVISVFALLFAVLVAVRKPLGHAYRSLSLMFLALSSSFFYSFTLAPASPLAHLSKTIQLTAYDLILFFYIGFVMHYQAYEPTRLRRCLSAIAPVYQAMALVGSACVFVFAQGYDLPSLSIYTRVLLGGGVALALLSLCDGWRSSVRDVRQRHLWLLGALSLGTVPAVLTTLPSLQKLGISFEARMVAFFLGQFAMYVLFVYATLKHRVFDFGYVMSRLAVKSITTGLLLFAFLVLEWMMASLLHPESGQGQGNRLWRFVPQAMPAIIIYIVFQLAHRHIEHGIEHLLLRGWESNKAQLRAYVASARRITSIDVLLDSLLTELDRFSGKAGAAIYQRQRDGGFEQVATTLADTPAGYDANHELVVTLCSDQAPVRSEPLADVGIDLALPMMRRGVLLGFVLLGCKSRGDGYRPDEVDILGWAVCQVGLDLRTLHVAQLERTASALENRNRSQRDALQAMLGRRSLQVGMAGMEGPI